MLKNNWLLTLTNRPQCAIRLFCFPYAGGGASVFHKWAPLFSEVIEICPVQLPGRENRFREQLLTDAQVVANQIVEVLGGFDDKPFAFFGHSLGARVAFLVANELKKCGRTGPRILFASGSRAPHLPPREEPIYHLPNAQFIEAVLEYGGMPDALLEDKELLELYIPILRADMVLNEAIKMDKTHKLSCDIMAFGGLGDPWVTRSDIDSWSVHTDAAFSAQMMDGGHFFINNKKNEIVKSISNGLNRISPVRANNRVLTN